jgi:hypothetical protein
MMCVFRMGKVHCENALMGFCDDAFILHEMQSNENQRSSIVKRLKTRALCCKPAAFVLQNA